MGFELAGAALLHDERAHRHAPLWSQPDVMACIALTLRNPTIASAVLRVIEAEVAKLPGGGVGLDQPLFPERDEIRRKAGA